MQQYHALRWVGPYFFEENGVTVTVNGHRYLKMLNEFFTQNCAEDVALDVARPVIAELQRKF